MKRIAANKILLDAETLLLNAVVEVDDGTVRNIFELGHCQVEPAGTQFFNGLITTFVPKENRILGKPVPELVTDALAIGYSGKLVLWQHLSLSSFKITADTQMIEL
ncbi:MAG: hypothetical protein ACI392_06260 [Paludibacteraceae bacterium]